MLWSFEKCTILTHLSNNLALLKHMRIEGLMRHLSLIGIDASRQLSLVCLLMGIIASFLRYTGYLNFINDLISHVLFQIQVHVLQPSCLYF